MPAMSPGEEVGRAVRAQKFLQDDLFKEAVQKLRDKAIKDFTSADPSDAQALMLARSMYEVTERFVNEFAMIVRTGQFAQYKLDDLEKSKRPKIHTPQHSTFA